MGLPPSGRTFLESSQRPRTAKGITVRRTLSPTGEGRVRGVKIRQLFLSRSLPISSPVTVHRCLHENCSCSDASSVRCGQLSAFSGQVSASAGRRFLVRSCPFWSAPSVFPQRPPSPSATGSRIRLPPKVPAPPSRAFWATTLGFSATATRKCAIPTESKPAATLSSSVMSPPFDGAPCSWRVGNSCHWRKEGPMTLAAATGAPADRPAALGKAVPVNPPTL